ncbi:MAG: hypothetical protein WCI96_05800 [Planctomycetota bacterium]
MALAQSAVLHNGVQVTLKSPVETFAVEGPLWDVDYAHRQLVSMGHRVTIPATLNGAAFVMGGTEVVNNEETSLGEITVLNFDRLCDANAAARDIVQTTAGAAGPIRLGPARSIHSTGEARGLAVAGLLDRTPAVEKAIEDTYFFLVRNAFLQYPAGVLPANFLGTIGIRTDTGAFPANNNQLPPRRFWRYPTVSGATFQAQGSVYVDTAGNQYLIPDFARGGYFATLIMSENVLIGNMVAAAIGNYNTPDSFVIGTTLCLMNQDPRMPLSILGIGNSPVSKEFFSTNAQPGMFLAVVGHMIGEHVMFAQVIDASANLFDPAVGAWVGIIDRTWGYRPGFGLDYTGSVTPIAGNTLYYEYGSVNALGTFVPTTPLVSLAPDLIIDPVLNTAKFVIRDQSGGDLTTARSIRFTVKKNAGGTVLRQTVYNWADLLGL